MTEGWDLVLIGAVLIGYAVFSRRLAGSPVTAAIVFVGAGLLFGGDGLEIVEIQLESADLRLLAEVTLALVLFTDATSLDADRLKRQTTLPVRLLGIALPLAIVIGTVVAIPLFSELGLWEAVVLAVLLAPTDAALGQTVVSDKRLPTMVRQGLNVESGLNDGVCVPILVAAVAFAELEEHPEFEGEVIVDLIKEVGIAVGVGLGVALVVVGLMRMSESRNWLGEEWARIVPLATAAVAYVATAELHGSGFIATFVAGLAYGRLLGPLAHRSIALNEEIGQLLSAITFFMFGAVMVGQAFDDIDASVVAYALLSLTLVRMVSVGISLVHTGARPPTMAFVGWFGPRGLATIVFTLTIVEESGLPGTTTITNAATITVLFSVVLHGVTAPALTSRYSEWLTSNPDPLAQQDQEPT
ncbi:MAG: cation:proton antiporter [Acidimicrobiales bacterium]